MSSMVPVYYLANMYIYLVHELRNKIYGMAKQTHQPL